MNFQLHTSSALALLIVFFGCSVKDSKKPTDPVHKNLELDLVISHFSDRIFYIGCSENQVSVVLRNNTDSLVNLHYLNDAYDNDNLSFVIKTFDSTYIITRKKNGWAHNMPADLKVDTFESVIFTCNVIDYHCYLGNRNEPVIRGDYHGWEGLPRKDYDSAFIKAIYEEKDFRDSGLQKLESKYYKVKIEQSDTAHIPFRKQVD